MIKHICTIFLFLIPCAFAHTADTLYANTSFVVTDSLQTVTTDTTLVTDSLSTLQKIQMPDTLVPITVGILYRESTVINRKTFLFTAYRYTGDLLRPFALNFIKDLGFIGHPNETFIYGVGNRGISYLQDGVLWNNRYTNSLDLNHVQSEDVDSIEIVPSPRGFLYGPYNNPVTVNLIMRDFLSPEPYSRIRYYEGPNGEAMIDGKFNAQIAKRWDLSFQVSNRKADETFKNTEYSTWQINTKLKYFLSNSVNITGLYSYVSSSIGLNGGIDIDSVRNITSDVNSIIYEPLLAPVVYPNRTIDVEQHNFGLRTLTKPFAGSKLDLSFYYRFDRNKVDDELDPSFYSPLNENKSFGTAFYIEQKISIAEFRLLTNYETRASHYFRSTESIGVKYDLNIFSVAPTLSIHLMSKKLSPSIFYKYTSSESITVGRQRNENLSGYGFDIKYNIFSNLFLYGGYSEYDCPSCQEKVKNSELSVNFNNPILQLNISWFKRSNLYLSEKAFPNGYNISFPKFGNLSGLGAVLNYKVWHILFETNTSYYFNPQNDKIYGVPELNFVGGIFINDYFFDDNLKVKTGFEFYYLGKINAYARNWGVKNIYPTNKLDFILIGEIQELAIVYFVWENLLDNQYFITPYYPMPESSIRFGLSWELFN